MGGGGLVEPGLLGVCWIHSGLGWNQGGSGWTQDPEGQWWIEDPVVWGGSWIQGSGFLCDSEFRMAQGPLGV